MNKNFHWVETSSNRPNLFEKNKFEFEGGEGGKNVDKYGNIPQTNPPKRTFCFLGKERIMLLFFGAVLISSFVFFAEI